ncbi:MAG: DNA polymerase III subunit alpha [Candidatus Berkelbacteria bacterium]|nr:DNA polymerase III subunit alpha [Candidatus Berkelbacteria bacterium]
MNFTHLHLHTHYSLLDGLGKPEEFILSAKEMGMNSLAITDHGAMYGAIEFYKAAKAAQIKPIIGVEVYVAPRSLTDKISKLDSSPYHLILLAKNLEGYQNLMKLTSIAHLEGFYYKPRVDKKILKKYSNGLIASSACLAGEIPRALLSNDEEMAQKALLEYQEIFGKDNFYLELQDHPDIKDQQIANEAIKKLAQKTQTPLVVSCDSHYVKKEDREAHDVLVCVQTGKTVDDPKRMTYDGDFSLRDPKELAEVFKDVPEALENTQKIADQCNLEIKFGENLLPDFPIPSKKSPDEFLKDICLVGLKERYPKADEKEQKQLLERLNYELSVIKKMGFADYFLIVADYVKWAKENAIMVGPGRGSAAGALVTYLAYITDVDPIRYGLLFERFLNPDRIEMPDIDLDFADHRRAQVLQYVSNKYGADKVAGIITFGTMAARAAIRDTGRALGILYAQVDAIAKIVPPPLQGKHIPLSKSIAENNELKDVYKRDPQAKRLLDMATKLEGTVRHASQHASAFVITRDELPCYVPLQSAQKEGVSQITQYSMYPVAELGLLKMDFLGLSNLTTIERALEIIEAVNGDKIDIFNLPLDDKKSFALLGKAQTVGVFQFESSGMQRYIKELKPTSIDDIAVMVALYRPGPMQFIDSFIARKNGREKITFPHEMTKSALEVTYGIPVYQEQVMQISKDMANFTGGEADKLRKAMGKKIAKLMAEMKVKFISGAEKNGVSTKQANEVFAMLEDFAAYGFNKSHAVCYAMIAYQTAYLKANYPECFMAALMTSDLNDIDRIAIEIEECERMKIDVLPPDVNESFVDFGVVKESGNIRFGLGAIKGIGENPARIIVKERKKNGPFKSLEDFVDRMINCEVDGVGERMILNKKILESLAKSGALDNFAERAQILAGMEIITKRIQDASKAKKTAQIGLFGEVLAADIEIGGLDLPQVEPATQAQRLAFEKEHLGIYISEHPLREVGEMLKQAVSHQIGAIDLNMDGKRVKIGGILTTIKKINTRSGQPMVFAGIEDLSGKSEVLVFPKLLQENAELWQNDNILLVEGKISTKDNQIKILADKAEKFDAEKIQKNMSNVPQHMVTVSDDDEVVEIDLSDEPEAKVEEEVLNEKFAKNELCFEDNGEFKVILPKGTSKEKLVELKEIFEKFPGELPVILYYKKNGNFDSARTKVQVSSVKELFEEIKKVLEK